MTYESKCPKCGASPENQIYGGRLRWRCGSHQRNRGDFLQHDQCRIRELTQQLATVTRLWHDAEFVLKETQAEFTKLLETVTRQRDSLISLAYDVADEFSRPTVTHWLTREGLPTQQESK